MLLQIILHVLFDLPFCLLIVLNDCFYVGFLALLVMANLFLDFYSQGFSILFGLLDTGGAEGLDDKHVEFFLKEHGFFGVIGINVVVDCQLVHLREDLDNFERLFLLEFDFEVKDLVSESDGKCVHYESVELNLY